MLVSAQYRPLLTVLRIESNFSSLHVIVPPYMENSPQFRFSCIDNDSPFKGDGSFPQNKLPSSLLSENAFLNQIFTYL